MEFECPVCYEDFQPPIYQCFNGHSLCKVCIDQVQSCPQCRDRLPCPRIRNTILEGQIASRASAAGGALIPCINASKGCKALMKPTRYGRHVGRCQLSYPPCVNAQYGCKAIFKPDKMAKHEMKCRYSRIANLLQSATTSRRAVNLNLASSSSSLLGASSMNPLRLAPCTFASNGCKAMVKPTGIESHSNECRHNFKEAKNYCRHMGIHYGCSAVVQMADWPSHAKDVHEFSVVRAKLNEEIEISPGFAIRARGMVGLGSLVSKPVVIALKASVGVKVFLLKAEVFNGERMGFGVSYFAFRDYANGNPHFAALTFFRENSRSTSLTWRGPVLEYGNGIPLEEGKGFSIPCRGIIDSSAWRIRVCISNGTYSVTSDPIAVGIWQ